MPELPDIIVYTEALESYVLDSPIEKLRIRSPFVVRSVEPPIGEVEGKSVRGIGRLGKQIVLSLEAELHLVLHLMIAGRLRWKKPGVPIPKKRGLAAFDLASGMPTPMRFCMPLGCHRLHSRPS
jgi:formamidopyrimidine-DNA glycosylase